MNSVPMRLMAWVMGLCPFLLAILFHTGLHSEPLAIPQAALPSLAFHQYAVDLKKIHPTTETRANFVFQNRGSEPVHITSIEPSCGCLTPLLQGVLDKTVPPGEMGRVILRMQPANSTVGPHEYTVTIRYTDPEPREVTLNLKLEIPQTTLTVTPPALMVYHPEGSEPTVTDFTVTDGRGKRFEITELSVNTELVEAVIGETNFTPTGNFQQTVRVTIVGALPPGKAQVLLRIGTDDTEVPEIRVPLLLEGPKRAADPAHDHEESEH